MGWGTQPLRTVCDNTTLRSSGARGLDVSRCYRHIAPLERKAAMHRNSRHCIHRGGEVSLPSGLGNPTPTASPFRYVVFAASLRRCVKYSSRITHRALRFTLGAGAVPPASTGDRSASDKSGTYRSGRRQTPTTSNPAKTRAASTRQSHSSTAARSIPSASIR